MLLVVKSHPANAGDIKRLRLNPWVRKAPWRRAQQPTPVFLPGESLGQRNLVGHGPWGRKELDTTERLSRQACKGNQNGRGQKSNQILNTCRVDRLVVNNKDLKSQTLKKKKSKKSLEETWVESQKSTNAQEVVVCLALSLKVTHTQSWKSV